MKKTIHKSATAISIKFSFLLLSLVTVKLNATNHYISSSGNDGNDGLTTVTAWLTISKLNTSWASIAAGDSILFRCGDTFAGSIKAAKSGASGSPIIIASYGTGAKPIISGFITLTGWTNTSGNIWESTVAETLRKNVNVLTINGIPQAVGRTDWMTYSSATDTTLTSSSLTGTPNYSGAEVVMKKNTFRAERALVTSQTTTTIKYAVSVQSLDNAGVSALQNGTANYGFFFQRFAGSLDQQGEWYYDSINHKMKIYSTTNPSTFTVKTSYVDTVINLNTRDYITVANLSIQGGQNYGIESKDADGITVQNCSFDNNTKGIYVWNGTDVLIKGDSLDHSLNGAILVNKSSNSTNKRSTIINNYIHNTGQLIGNGIFNRDTDLNGIIGYTDTVTVSNFIEISGNVVRNTGNAPIRWQGSNATIRRNWTDSFANQIDDMGGIYTFITNSALNAKFYSNRIVDSNMISNAIGAPLGSPSGNIDVVGLYMDDQTSYVTARHNSIWNVPGVGMQINTPLHMTLTDNTVYNCTYGINLNKKIYGPVTNNLINRNIVYQKSTSQYQFFYTNVNLSSTGETITQALQSMATIDTNWISNLKTNGYKYYYSATGGGYTFPPDFNFATWQSSYLHDLVSKLPPITVTATNTRFIYNPTNTPQQFSLHDSIYLGVDSVLYNDSITIQPFSSKVLIFKDICTLPAGWSTSDVGTVGIKGSACEDGGIFTVQASGADIYGTKDHFRFAYQSVSGTNTIIAKVNSFTGAGTTAKAGVMIRETLSDGSKNAFVNIRPNAATNLQYRTATNGSSATATGASTASFPYWVKITRQVDTIKAYISPNGTTWTLKNSVVINLPSSVYMGLAVTNTSNLSLGTAVFDSVSIQSGVLRVNNSTPISTINFPVRNDVYPNPSNGSFYIAINASKTEKAAVSIASLKGQVIMQQSRSLLKGNNKINMSVKDFGLAAGVYLIKVASETTNFTGRLIIQ